MTTHAYAPSHLTLHTIRQQTYHVLADTLYLVRWEASRHWEFGAGRWGSLAATGVLVVFMRSFMGIPKSLFVSPCSVLVSIYFLSQFQAVISHVKCSTCHNSTSKKIDPKIVSSRGLIFPRFPHRSYTTYCTPTHRIIASFNQHFPSPFLRARLNASLHNEVKVSASM